MTTIFSAVMSRLSYTLGRKGQLNYPGISFASKKCAESLLLKDAETHHCFFRTAGLHNHLSHQYVASYRGELGLRQRISVFSQLTTWERPPAFCKRYTMTKPAYNDPLLGMKKTRQYQSLKITGSSTSVIQGHSFHLELVHNSNWIAVPMVHL